jgi:hypothetical protein
MGCEEYGISSDNVDAALRLGGNRERRMAARDEVGRMGEAEAKRFVLMSVTEG